MNNNVIRSLTGSAEQPVLNFRRRYRATASEVREAVTDPERLARWFGEVDGAPANVGDAFTARMGDAVDHAAVGTVLRCDERTITVSWSRQGEPESLITARIEPVTSDETDLLLVHELREPTHAVGYGGGWEQMLSVLGRSVGGKPADDGDLQIEAAAVAHWRTISRQPLDLQHRIDAPVESVWAAFASAAGLSAWWWSHWSDVRIDADVRVGGAYRIEAPGAGIVLTGRYLTVEEGERLAFTWEWNGPDGTTSDEAVDLAFAPDGAGGCVLSIRHTGPWTDEDSAQAYRQGWESTLPALDRLLAQIVVVSGDPVDGQNAPRNLSDARPRGRSGVPPRRPRATT